MAAEGRKAPNLMMPCLVSKDIIADRTDKSVPFQIKDVYFVHFVSFSRLAIYIYCVRGVDQGSAEGSRTLKCPQLRSGDHFGGVLLICTTLTDSVKTALVALP